MTLLLIALERPSNVLKAREYFKCVVLHFTASLRSGPELLHQLKESLFAFLNFWRLSFSMFLLPILQLGSRHLDDDLSVFPAPPARADPAAAAAPDRPIDRPRATDLAPARDRDPAPGRAPDPEGGCARTPNPPRNATPTGPGSSRVATTSTTTILPLHLTTVAKSRRAGERSISGASF